MNDNYEPKFGATLYIPAINENLVSTAGGKLDGLGTLVICLEDAIRDDQVTQAVNNLKCELPKIVKNGNSPTLYIRARTPGMAENIMKMEGFENIRGFVIPKATADSLPDWMAVFRGVDIGIMPTIETAQAFDTKEIHRLRDQIFALGLTVDMVRIGGNDILSLIGARRSKVRTLYEGPLGTVVSRIVGVFSNSGIMLSSPVFEHYSNTLLLEEEIERDVEHGIFNKTAIHPAQIPVINKGMQPTATEVMEAQAILAENAKGVFGFDGSMCEPKTHSRWADMVLARKNQLGIRTEITDAIAI